MPVITLEAAALDREQKKRLVEALTESAARSTNMSKESFYVLLMEYTLDTVGVGGVLLSEKNAPGQN